MQKAIPRLVLEVQSGRISTLIAILQTGFVLFVPAGSTVRAVLDAAGFSRSYLEDKVKTVFLDGSAVDDLAMETVTKGSVIALSAAMPGLAGAIFRKDSPISGLRSHFDARPANRPVQDAEEPVVLKMFNIIAEDMGPRLLADGVLISGRDVANFLAARRELLQKAIVGAELDGSPIESNDLFAAPFADSEHILFRAREQSSTG